MQNAEYKINSNKYIMTSNFIHIFFSTREGPRGHRSFIDSGGIQLQEGPKDKNRIHHSPCKLQRGPHRNF